MSPSIDLNRYWQRIGLSGDTQIDLPTLTKIQAGHSSCIPFENLSVLRDLPILLDNESLQEKLVNQRQGGYCFEQNGLLLAVLQQVGFDAKPLSGRVRMGVERDFLPPRTHLFIRVELNGEPWIVDGGVGGMSLTAPIRFKLNAEQETPHETRRIVQENGVYFHQALVNGEWVDVYEFTGEEMAMIDREVGNWWTSTNPRSKFKQGLFCALARPNGERHGRLYASTRLGNPSSHRDQEPRRSARNSVVRVRFAIPRWNRIRGSGFALASFGLNLLGQRTEP